MWAQMFFIWVNALNQKESKGHVSQEHNLIESDAQNRSRSQERE